jgi:5'-nucleotidase
MNLLGLEFNSVGNHEFDRGSDELKRMQSGGCAKFTRREPCAVEPFTGARFRYLAANVLQGDGTTVFPATGIKRFGPITIGFIGMTLKGTATLVTPAGVKGLSFADEAATANALVPQLKAQGADAIVLNARRWRTPAHQCRQVRLFRHRPPPSLRSADQAAARADCRERHRRQR